MFFSKLFSDISVTYQTKKNWYAWRMQTKVTLLEGRDLHSKLIESRTRMCTS